MDKDTLAQLQSMLPTDRAATIMEMVEAVHDTIGLDRLNIQMIQNNSNYVCIATAESFISLSCSGEGSSAREAEIKGKAALLRDLTGLNVKFKEEDSYGPKEVTASAPTPTQPAKVNRPTKPAVSAYQPIDLNTLKALTALMKLGDEDKEAYFQAWNSSNGGKIPKLSPENIKGFLTYLTRKATEIYGKEEVDQVIAKAKADSK